MDLVKLEIDGKRVIADNRQTILEVARENGIDIDPDALPRRAARAVRLLLPLRGEGARGRARSCPPAPPRSSGGMVVETDTPEVRRSRKAALELMLSQPLRRLHRPLPARLPGRRRHPGLRRPGGARASTRTRSSSSRSRNPLPAVCGRVCTRPCEVTGCRRNLLDEAVGIDYIKRYVADLDLGAGRAVAARPLPPPTASGSRSSGAGPAGLSCAYYLALKGYDVHIFESLPEAGGMLRYGIPEYRLPKEVLDLEINQILDLGVKLSTNVALGKDFTVAEPEGGRLRRGLPRARRLGQLEDAGPGRGGRRGPARASTSCKNFGLQQAKADIHGRGPGGRRRQHRDRLRAHRAAPRRERGPPPLPAHADRDAGQRDGDRRGGARGGRRWTSSSPRSG